MIRFFRISTKALIWVALMFGALRGAVWLASAEMTAGLSGPAQVLQLPAETPGPGGLSGLIVHADGAAMRAASDHGVFLDAQITRDAQGRAIGLQAARLVPLLSRAAAPLITFHSDLEGITPLQGGAMGLAFESYTRLLFLPPPDAQGDLVPKALHGWQKFEEHFGNRAFEAIATLPSGDMLAILERKETPDRAQAYLYTKSAWRGPHEIPAQPGWAVSGADVGPDGCLYLLERRYTIWGGFQTQLARLRGRLVPPFDLTREVIWRAPHLRMGNGEGLSLWAGASDQITASIITDDGFPPDVFGPLLSPPSRLVELPLQAAPGCLDRS